MANRKASLVKNIQVNGEWRLCRIILHRNGSPKCVVHHGEQMPLGNGKGGYKIRFYEGSRLRYTSVGHDPAEAVRRWRAQCILMTNPDVGLQAPEEHGPQPLAQLVREFYTRKNCKPGDN
jgi:hypothetical protein